MRKEGILSCHGAIFSKAWDACKRRCSSLNLATSCMPMGRFYFVNPTSK
ncbi:MAG: hypothetical protein ACTSYC_02900 [Promethearchaeota archaeon]